MKRIALALLLVALASGAWAQSNPGLITGQVPTAAQWNSYFAAKQDFTGSSCPTTGCTFTGPVVFGGQISSTTGTPAASCPGASGTIVGTNQSGSLSVSAAAATTCTVSFSATLAVAPNACVLFPANAAAAATGTTVARVSSISTTNFVVTGSALASTSYYYICL